MHHLTLIITLIVIGYIFVASAIYIIPGAFPSFLDNIERERFPLWAFAAFWPIGIPIVAVVMSGALVLTLIENGQKAIYDRADKKRKEKLRLAREEQQRREAHADKYM